MLSIGINKSFRDFWSHLPLPIASAESLKWTSIYYVGWSMSVFQAMSKEKFQAVKIKFDSILSQHTVFTFLSLPGTLRGQCQELQSYRINVGPGGPNNPLRPLKIKPHLPSIICIRIPRLHVTCRLALWTLLALGS